MHANKSGCCFNKGKQMKQNQKLKEHWSTCSLWPRPEYVNNESIRKITPGRTSTVQINYWVSYISCSWSLTDEVVHLMRAQMKISEIWALPTAWGTKNSTRYLNASRLALCTAWTRGAKIVRHQTHNSKPDNVTNFGQFLTSHRSNDIDKHSDSQKERNYFWT